MSFDEIFDLTAEDAFYFFIVYLYVTVNSADGVVLVFSFDASTTHRRPPLPLKSKTMQKNSVGQGDPTRPV